MQEIMFCINYERHCNFLFSVMSLRFQDTLVVI